ncbi:MAG: hypothetical protein ABH891_09545 [Candidatus Omnitrophota bacterium]
MSEHSEENEALSVPLQTDADVVSLIKKMQQQLNFLEKKIDILIGQSPERPFGDREKRFSKPFRPSFGGGAHHGKGNFNRGPRKEGFSHDRPREGGFSHGRPREGGFSKDRAREGGFSQDRPRERSFGQERPFDRKPGAGPRGFGHGDKPFFRHRKGPRS